MSVILEGPDNSGKTTFAKSFFMGHRYAHMSRPDEAFDYGNDYLNLIEKARKEAAVPDLVLYDRLHLGGLIYGYTLGLHPVVRKTPQDFQDLGDIIRNRYGIVVAVLYWSDLDEYRSWLVGHKDRDEMYNIDQNVRIAAAWALIARNPHFVDSSWDISKLGWPSEAFADHLRSLAVARERKIFNFKIQNQLRRLRLEKGTQ